MHLRIFAHICMHACTEECDGSDICTYTHTGRVPLTVHPNVACAATSQAYGQGLTLATAGIAASFTIVVRDQYGNVREDPTGFGTYELSISHMIYSSQIYSSHVRYKCVMSHIKDSLSHISEPCHVLRNHVTRSRTQLVWQLGCALYDTPIYLWRQLSLTFHMTDGHTHYTVAHPYPRE